MEKLFGFRILQEKLEKLIILFAFILFPFVYLSFRKYSLVKDKIDATSIHPNCMQLFIYMYIATFCFYFTLSVEVFRKYKSCERQNWCNFGLSQLYATFITHIAPFCFYFDATLVYPNSQLYKCIKSVFSKENQYSTAVDAMKRQEVVREDLSSMTSYLFFFESNSWISLNRLLWSSKPQTSFPILQWSNLWTIFINKSMSNTTFLWE